MEDRKTDDDEEEDAFDVAEPQPEDSEGDDEVYDTRMHSNAGSSTSKSTLWVILATTATLMGRRVLTSGFRTFSSFGTGRFL
jgi:hypothetical protein